MADPVERLEEPLRIQISPHTNRPDPARALRIGFVSGDFRDHPVARFIERILAQCSTAEFEIFCYSDQTTQDEVSARLRGQAEHWRDVAELSDDDLADAIRHDAIDILVDLSGRTAGNRPLVFARKPAPIQVCTPGCAQILGLSAMDDCITDEARDPAGANETFRVEELVQLPAGAVPFFPAAECPPVNELPALSNGFVTFGSFNHSARVTPEALAAWAEILRAVPSARLIVAGGEGNLVQQTLVEQGIAAERIEVVPRLPLKEYLALHHRVDLRLDTFPGNGGAALLLAAWMGMPFVTVASESTTGWNGASMLRLLGLGGLVASGAADYVQRAVVAASDLPRLAQWRMHLREKCAPLFGDGESCTRQLERAFREMWKKWCATRTARNTAASGAASLAVPA